MQRSPCYPSLQEGLQLPFNTGRTVCPPPLLPLPAPRSSDEDDYVFDSQDVALSIYRLWVPGNCAITGFAIKCYFTGETSSDFSMLMDII